MKTKTFIDKTNWMIQVIKDKDFPKIEGRAYFFKRAARAIDFLETHKIEGELNKRIFIELKSIFDKLILKGGENE